MPKSKKQSIDPEDLLTAEFEYIAQTAEQANEDRTSVISFFLIAVGSPLAALFSTEALKLEIESKSVSFLFSGLFFILTFLGTSTILQLARLRGAWYESMLAMNHMKEFLIKNSDFDISGAFLWRATTAPKRFKINSVNFYQAAEVAILSGLLFAACIFFLLQGLNGTTESSQNIILGLSIVLGLLNIWFQINLYRRFVN